MRRRRVRVEVEQSERDLLYDAFDIAKIIVRQEMTSRSRGELLQCIFMYDNCYLIKRYRKDLRALARDVDHWVSMMLDGQYRHDLELVKLDITQQGRDIPIELIEDPDNEDINLTFKRLRVLSLFVNKNGVARIKLRRLLKEYGKKRRSSEFVAYMRRCMEFYRLTAYVDGAECDISTVGFDLMISFKAADSNHLQTAEGTRMKLKALSVRQPWAAAIAWGGKTVETRSYPTAHRGPLLIVASKTQPDFSDEEMRAAELSLGHPFEWGKAVAVADLVDCRPLREEDLQAAYMGDWALDDDDVLYGWHLKNIRPIEPFPVRGQIKMFDVECEPVFIKDPTVRRMEFELRNERAETAATEKIPPKDTKTKGLSSDLKFEITEHIGTISENAKGWTKELNIVSWNGRDPKYDLREWDPEHKKMGKGVTLSKNEIEKLKDILARM